jgi:hypothetical protein
VPPGPKSEFIPVALSIKKVIKDIHEAEKSFALIDAEMASIEGAILRCDKNAKLEVNFDFQKPVDLINLYLWWLELNELPDIKSDFTAINANLEVAIPFIPLPMKPLVKKTLVTKGHEISAAADGLVKKGESTEAKAGQLKATIQKSKCKSIPLNYVSQIDNIAMSVQLNINELKGSIKEFKTKYQQLVGSI